MADLLIHCENLGNVHPSIVGKAFSGHIDHMISLLEFVQGDYVNDVKKFLLALFPQPDQCNIRIFYKGHPIMLQSVLMNYFNEQYMI